MMIESEKRAVATLGVRQASIVKHLQQQVTDFRMSLLDLIKQNHAVRTSAHLPD